MINNKVLHFSDGFSLKEINEVLSNRKDIIYYTRDISEKKEFHIINNRNGEFKMTQLIIQLFDFYKKNEILTNIIGNSKVKGNDIFSIIIDTNEELINQIKKDLNNLLKN